MKVFFIFSLVANSVFSEAPYPPSGYRPLGPQFELPTRTEQPETDVETFSDTVVVQDATDRQLNNNNLWPTSQQLPTFEPAQFRAAANPRKYPLNVVPLERVTTVEFYQAPVQLLSTEINYPVDRKSPIVKTTTFANVNGQNYRISSINNNSNGKTESGTKAVKQSRGETTDDFKPSNENSFTESTVDENETTTINTVKQSVRFRSAVRRKTLRTPKVGSKKEEAGHGENSANDLPQQALFTRNPSEGSNQKSKQRSHQDSRTTASNEPLIRKPSEQNLRSPQGGTSIDYDNTNGLSLDDGKDNNISNPQTNQSPQDTYGVPAIEVTSSRPRRRKTRRRKITTTTTTTTTSTTEAPGYTESEESVPENENPNVAISTAVAGLPPSVYLVHEPTSGQLRLLRLRIE
ncbi:uncharacterized protein LOC108736316 isoform X2 [Agrilus planipennis]|uniref:Uncharacterized protein LOC108736316 isoform X2 n=1 Tax=Agrilus planipennis TaxID=224129 RepID=A0A1W4WVV9_AGRPL|nr:uncharacterized protein LOC108736316 isoform X2 [Agrilus planipennis]